MSQGCALLILRSKGQRSRSWRMVIFLKWFPDDNWLCNQPMINFIHLLPMSQGCALLILGSKGQRSRSWRMVIWKWSTEIMVADLNLLGSVGDLYCFSNTFSMLLYVATICCPSCYKLQSSLQMQCSVLLDDGTSHAHYLTPDCTCCEVFYQNYFHSVFWLFIVTEYKFTIPGQLGPWTIRPVDSSARSRQLSPYIADNSARSAELGPYM